METVALKKIEDISKELNCYVYNQDMVELIYKVEFVNKWHHRGRFGADACEEEYESIHKRIDEKEDSLLGGKTLVFNLNTMCLFDLDRTTGIYNKQYCEVDCIKDVTIKIKLKDKIVTWGEIYNIVSGVITKNGYLLWEMNFTHLENNEVEVYLRD